MTMIAIACKGDHAEIVADSMAYNQSCSSIKPTTKVVMLTHLDTAIATQGDSNFGALVQGLLLKAGMDSATTYDELICELPGLLRDVWTKFAGKDLEGTVFAVGPSDDSGQFESVAFSHDTDFAAQPLQGLFVIPSPLTNRPHDLELIRIRQGSTDPQLAPIIDEWVERPSHDVPDGIKDWVDLAKKCRTRGLISFADHLVMGSVKYLYLERGMHQGANIHDFDDTGDEFAKLMEGSNHPVSLGGPCHCESGERLIDCHAAPFLDEACGCEIGVTTGKTLRECCGAIVLLPTSA